MLLKKKAHGGEGCVWVKYYPYPLRKYDDTMT